ncbi:MAG: aminotransferase class I/II-fold pyridoxal phosphate-dependent enzyme [Zetaproteobacteria bacterium]|nr:MAG: aminotransferase class I/II-fold pyridoxal phosphate-dependent enzyme [Zetaproteobacteria bacterium]
MDTVARKAKRMANLPVYLMDEVVRLKNQAAARGMDVIDLGVGDPDFPTPPHILAAAHVALDDDANHHYSSYRGLADLRRAFAAWYRNRFGVALDPETEVLPLIGSKEGIGHIHLAFVEPGDEVLVPDPGYPTYQGGTILAGGTPRYYPLRAETGWLPDLQDLERQDLSRVKLMHINYPSNPTAASASMDFFAQMAALGERHGILVCHDNAYSEVYFDGIRPPSFLQAEGAKGVGIEFHSLSKTYLMTGWRIGVAVGQADAIAALGDVKSNYETGIFPVVQRAGVAALSGDQSLLEEMRRRFQRRRDLFVDGLNRIGFATEKPQATFYAWSRIPGGEPSAQFARRLLDDAGVVVTPGAGFGPHGEGYFRAALTVDEARLSEAIERIRRVSR